MCVTNARQCASSLRSSQAKDPKMIRKLKRPCLQRQSSVSVFCAECYQVLKNIKDFRMKPKDVKSYLDRFVMEQDECCVD